MATGGRGPEPVDEEVTGQVPETNLEDYFLNTVSRKLGPEWFQLALALHLDYATVQQIKHDNPNNVQHQSMHMLYCWRNAQSGGAQEQKRCLVQALEEIRRSDLATTVESMSIGMGSGSQTTLQVSAVPEANLDDHFLNTVSRELGPEWVQLALTLHLSYTTVQRIKHDHPNNVRHQSMVMLYCWRNAQSGGAQEEKRCLVQALQDIGRTDLATTVESRSIEGGNGPQPFLPVFAERTFYRLNLQGTSGMFRDRDLSIMYGASQGLGIEEVVIGLSENSADLPELRAGQRRLTPVLICMPHNATLSSSLSVNLPTLPHTGAITVLYRPAPDTQQQQDGGEWRPVYDVCYYIHEHSISLVLTHFCMYCIVEETLQPSPPSLPQPQPQPKPSLLQRLAGWVLSRKPSKKKARKDTLLQLSSQPQTRHRIVSVFLRAKPLKTKDCVEVALQWSESRGEAPLAELRGKLVNQKQFPLVNTRPITISVEPADGWSVRQEEKERPLYDVDLEVCDYHTFHLFGDAATQDMVAFEVLLSQCQGYERKLYVCESYEELIGESPCRSRPVQENVWRQRNPSNPLDDKNNGSSTSQSADVSHAPVTASRSQHPSITQQRDSQPRKRSLKCQDDTNQITPCTEIARGNGTSPMTAGSQVHTVTPGNLPEQQQAVSVDVVSDETIPDNYWRTNFCEPVPELAPRSPEIERADPAYAEDGPSPDASGSLESGLSELRRAAQGDAEVSLANDEAHVPGAGGETAGNMALERVTSVGHLLPALANLPPRHGQIQINLKIEKNYYNHNQEGISVKKWPWPISYEKCAKVAEYLDLNDHNWKMLASKLHFDEAIERVEREAGIERRSPTIKLLREWMQDQGDEGATTLNERLVKALLELKRRDIVDEIEELE